MRQTIERELERKRTAKRTLIQRLARFQTDPVGYAEQFLKLALTDDQREILRSLVDNRQTAIKASHAVGKTFIAAVAACWWFDCWEEHIVYITAPTWAQALGLTFKQITRLRRERGLGGEILESGLVRDADRYAAGAHYIKAINSESGEGFQGEHTAPILQIYEEAVGVPGYIWEAGRGLMTHPECRLLAVANPTDEATQFGEACANPNYRTMTISALQHPNIVAELTGQEPPFPNAVRLMWLEEMIADECEPSDPTNPDAFEFPTGSGNWWLPNAVFQGRAMGEFPSQADQQVIPAGWLRNLPVLPLSRLPEIGCDVARYGSDRTTIAGRCGAPLLALREVRQFSNTAVVGALRMLAEELGARFQCNPKKIPIRVDVTGGLGAGPVDFLAEEGYNVIGINSSSKALEADAFPNKRSELWWTLRNRARAQDLDFSHVDREMRERLIRELSTPKWKPDSAGRKVVEKKDDIKKRLGASPDLADAVNLAYDGTGGWAMVEEQLKQEREDDDEWGRESEALEVRW